MLQVTRWNKRLKMKNTKETRGTAGIVLDNTSDASPD